jgi:hypothetical protein
LERRKSRVENIFMITLNDIDVYICAGAGLASLKVCPHQVQAYRGQLVARDTCLLFAGLIHEEAVSGGPRNRIVQHYPQGKVPIGEAKGAQCGIIGDAVPGVGMILKYG